MIFFRVFATFFISWIHKFKMGKKFQISMYSHRTSNIGT